MQSTTDKKRSLAETFISHYWAATDKSRFSGYTVGRQTAILEGTHQRASILEGRFKTGDKHMIDRTGDVVLKEVKNQERYKFGVAINVVGSCK